MFGKIMQIIHLLQTSLVMTILSRVIDMNKSTDIIKFSDSTFCNLRSSGRNKTGSS